MSDKKEEHYSIYTIPYNFIDESKVFGGMISTRKLVEGCILGAFFSFPFFLFSLPNQINPNIGIFPCLWDYWMYRHKWRSNLKVYHLLY